MHYLELIHFYILNKSNEYIQLGDSLTYMCIQYLHMFNINNYRLYHVVMGMFE